MFVGLLLWGCCGCCGGKFCGFCVADLGVLFCSQCVKELPRPLRKNIVVCCGFFRPRTCENVYFVKFLRFFVTKNVHKLFTIYSQIQGADVV